MASSIDRVSLVVQDATGKLLTYCRDKNWAGYDPYDALNSSLFKRISLLDQKLPRLALTQMIKRSPWNLRPLLGVPKTQNPKGLALFLQATLQLSKHGMISTDAPKSLASNIEQLRAPEQNFWCWGYSFPWQTRSLLVPLGAPNLVCTTFVAQALLDLYEESQNEKYLEIAISAADFLVDELFWKDSGTVASFSYPFPSSRTPVHNANFLAAAFLCRVYRFTDEERYLGPALKAARYSIRRQQQDGSWFYGESPKQKWIDNFHTGYNLCALQEIGKYAGTNEFEGPVAKGFAFYRQNFFTPDAAAKYFHNRTFPVDVHSVAQSIITLLQFRSLHPENVTLAFGVADWALKNLWDPRGYFYHQKLRVGRIKIPYMRWGQAWMLLAFSKLLGVNKQPDSQANHRIKETQLTQ